MEINKVYVRWLGSDDVTRDVTVKDVISMFVEPHCGKPSLTVYYKEKYGTNFYCFELKEIIEMNCE